MQEKLIMNKKLKYQKPLLMPIVSEQNSFAVCYTTGSSAGTAGDGCHAGNIFTTEECAYGTTNANGCLSGNNAVSENGACALGTSPTAGKSFSLCLTGGNDS